MGDMGDFWRDVKEARRERRAAIGIDCPGCKIVRPKAPPTRLMPHMRCKVCQTTYYQAKVIRDAAAEQPKPGGGQP